MPAWHARLKMRMLLRKQIQQSLNPEIPLP